MERTRRLRMNERVRDMVRENHVRVDELIYPIFVIEGENICEPVESMPGICQYSIDRLHEELDRVREAGIPAVLLFGIPAHKDEQGSGAYAEDGIVPQAIRYIKKNYKELVVVADVCLCEYTSHGHCGLICDGEVLNDETLPFLSKASVVYAKAGADIIAPSDMMDGRIGRIRQALEENGHINTQIMAYSAKYASNYYGPFRDAVGSAGNLKGGDKKTYQLDPANGNEGLQEVALDLQEGADMVMVKPGMPYLDMVYRVKEYFGVPTFAYQVSGEYAMHMAAIQNGWLKEKECIMESLLCFKRAGADGILTYFAKQVAEWLYLEGKNK